MKDNKNNYLTKFLSWLSVPAKGQQSFLIRLAIFWIIMTAIIVIDPNQMLDDITVGKPAPKNLICPKYIEFNDQKETENLKAKAMDEEPSFYDINPQANKQMLEDFDKNIKRIIDFYDAVNDKGSRKTISQVISEKFPDKFILDSRELHQLSILSVNQLDDLVDKARKKITELSKEQITDQNIESIKKKVRDSIEKIWEASANFKHLLTTVIENSLRTNAVLNQEETLRRKKEAANNVLPVLKHYQKGQKIVAEGDIVTEEVYNIFKGIQKELTRNVFLALLGSMILLVLFIGIAIAYIRTQDVNVFVDDVQYKLIATICFICLLATKVVYGISHDFDNRFYFMVLLSPLASFVLLLNATMSNLKIVYFSVFWMGLLSFIVTLGGEPFVVGLMIALIIGAVCGVLSWEIAYKDKEGNMRSFIIKTGLSIGITTMLAVLAVLLIDSEISSVYGYTTMFGYVICGLINGFFSGIVTNGFLPYIEDYFSFATPTKLLELTSEESPLLKRLAEEAPGTYQHSKAVANLAAQAASAVDADPLLTKVCALYHDIGKIKRPEYYTENQQGENPHDEKKPTMSALIIATHVKDGAEIARDNKIPHRVIEVMSQHHGTTLIEYFFNKQKELTPDSVDESQFRYKSLKPQSKEAAILLLADAVEASTRSLDDLNPEKIKANVKRIVDHKIKDDNQLEETNLTLKDIDTIEDEFVKVLISANHKRIKYQNQMKEEAAAKAAAAKEEAAATKADIERRAIIEEEKMDKIEAEAKAEAEAKSEVSSKDNNIDNSKVNEQASESKTQSITEIKTETKTDSDTEKTDTKTESKSDFETNSNIDSKYKTEFYEPKGGLKLYNPESETKN